MSSIAWLPAWEYCGDVKLKPLLLKTPLDGGCGCRYSGDEVVDLWVVGGGNSINKKIKGNQIICIIISLQCK